MKNLTWQILKHNFRLLRNDPKRAFYYVEGSLLWLIFRKVILKNLRVAIEIDKAYDQKFFSEMTLFQIRYYFGSSLVSAWAIRRYMLKYNSCRPCFEGSGCEKCGCSVDEMFMSSIKCRSNEF